METQSAVETLINPQDVSTGDSIDKLLSSLLSGNFEELESDLSASNNEINRDLAAEQTNEENLSSELEIATISPTQVAYNFQDLTTAENGGIGRGFGDPNNYYAWSVIEYNNQLFVGTLNFEGGQIWKTSLDEANLSTPPPQWEQVFQLADGVDGFRELIVYEDLLYAFTTDDGGQPENSLRAPAGYVSADEGDTWQEIEPFPINNPNNSSIRTAIVHDGLLYIGTFDETGGEIWTYDGGTDGTDGNFNLVRKFPSDIRAVSDFVEFDGELYAGTFYLSDGEHRADPTPRYFWTGENFETNVAPSFLTRRGTERRFNQNNEGVPDAAVFQDQLYISTANLRNGFSLFRTSDPLTGEWEIITQDGFGNRNNAYGWDFGVYDDPSTSVVGDRLFLGTFNPGFYNGNLTLFDGVPELWTTTDGVNWEQVSLPDFGSLTFGIRNVEVTSNDKLVLGTAINFDAVEGDDLGMQIWIADL